MFGTSVGVSPWAATIAAKRLVPVIPMWFSSVPGGVQVAIGEELIASDAQALVRHYMGYFEQQILADPASWAYLADKHWRRVLRRAARGGAPPDAAAATTATTVNTATP
jgi:lauroyl/myristoyl acyltransferase